MINELNKEMDVDKYKIRSWSKDDFSTLAKYLNNKKIWDNCRDSLPYPYSETMRNNSSCPFQAKTNKIIIVSK